MKFKLYHLLPYAKADGYSNPSYLQFERGRKHMCKDYLWHVYEYVALGYFCEMNCTGSVGRKMAFRQYVYWYVHSEILFLSYCMNSRSTKMASLLYVSKYASLIYMNQVCCRHSGDTDAPCW